VTSSFAAFELRYG